MAAGLQPGLGLAEARARFPRFDFRQREEAPEQRLLEAVADWCDRYTPLVALDGAQGLVLDISGCAHLFGGEKGLVADLLSRLGRFGFQAEAAVAPFAGTATALAGRGTTRFVEPGEEVEAVAPLGVEALRLEPELCAKLRRLGLKRVADLLPLPREGLARRFGEDLLHRLDEAAGRRTRPISPRLPVPSLLAERRFAEPIALLEDVERVLLLLADRLSRDLERRGEGGRRFELTLFRVDGHVERLGVGASAPLREAGRVLSLFQERLSGMEKAPDAGFGYDLVRLSVPRTEAMTERQEDLTRERGEAREDLSTLLDRLSARLGEASVTASMLTESHWPERAEIRRPAAAGFLGAKNGAVLDLTASAPRPARLLDRPEPVETMQALPDGPPLNFRWRRALHVVRSYEGPERIGTEWWREAEGAMPRDYYSVEDDHGRRYWMFRQADPSALRPDWFMHGLFA